MYEINLTYSDVDLCTNVAFWAMTNDYTPWSTLQKFITMETLHFGICE